MFRSAAIVLSLFTCAALAQRPVSEQPESQQAEPQSHRVEELPTNVVYRPMCGSAERTLSAEDLRIARQLNAKAVLRTAAAGAEPPLSLDLVIVPTTELPPGAAEAIAAVEQYVEAKFTDPVQIQIDLGFTSLSGGVLGATSNTFIQTPWPQVRDALLLGMDSDDTIQGFLPPTDTIPVRFDALSSTVTQENQVFVPHAAFIAGIGEATDPSASMVFNLSKPWGFDPENLAVGQFSFRDVLTHEIGHALGFTSAADTRNFDIEIMDIFRFQMSDGSENYNPDSMVEFTTTPRLVDKDPATPLDDDDVVCDIIEAEYRMADGVPNQASHFHPEPEHLYLMEPTFAPQETESPNYYRSGDLAMLDAIGWDYPATNTSCGQAAELVCGVRHFDNASAGGAPMRVMSCGAGNEQDGALWFRFTATSSATKVSTCGSLGSDSTMAAYRGECGKLLEIGCAEDNGCGEAGGLSTICLTDLVVGETYYVQVAARTSADRGTYSLELECSCDAACSDVCCIVPDPPTADPEAIEKNRYITLMPPSTSRPSALRVTFDNLYDPQPVPSSGPDIDFSSFENQVRWVGPPVDYTDDTVPPTTFRGAKLQCDPYFQDWSAETVLQVTGAGIVPSSVYTVEAIDFDCFTAHGTDAPASDPLELRTSRWGDVAPPFYEMGGPSQPNVLDLKALVQKLKQAPSAPLRFEAQLVPDVLEPNKSISILDVAAGLRALSDYNYNLAGPQVCP